jgi:hypothetical protein
MVKHVGAYIFCADGKSGYVFTKCFAALNVRKPVLQQTLKMNSCGKKDEQNTGDE